MKILSITFLFAAALLFSMPGLAAQPGFAITSPDRPPMWFNVAGDKVAQNLEWSPSRQRLLLRVSYSEDANWHLHDQSFYDTVTLSFPSVRLNETTRELYFVDAGGRPITIGRIVPGVFGKRVALDKNVKLSAHRQNQVVTATLLSADLASRPTSSP